MTLIVVLGDDDVVCALGCAQEDRVRKAAGRSASRPRSRAAWIAGSMRSASSVPKIHLAGMWIQSGDGDPGPCDTESPAGIMSDLDHILDPLWGYARDCVVQGNVGADVDDAQIWADQSMPTRCTGPLR